MRGVHLKVLLILVTAAPAAALAQGLPAGAAPRALDAGVRTAATAAEANAPLASAPRAESNAIPILIEALSPLGGAGQLSRHRYVSGTVVMLGSLISASLLAVALAQSDLDTALAGGVAYGIMRAIGLVAAGQPEAAPPRAPSFAAPTDLPGTSALHTVNALGATYRLSF